MSEQTWARAKTGSKAATNISSKGSLLQRAAVNSDPVNDIPPSVYDALHVSGQPLDEETQVFMESRFGHDFSNVRVHTDAGAAESARSVNALAYTVGHDIVFETGRYTPNTTAGKRLLAHELTHVLQQKKAPLGRLQLANSPAHQTLELEALQVSERLASPAPTSLSSQHLSHAPMGLYRQEAASPPPPSLVDQMQVEARRDARQVKAILQGNTWLGSYNQRDIMHIIQKWADKSLDIARTRLTPFDLFIVALGNVSFEVGWIVSEYTNAFDQLYRRMDDDGVEQIKNWVKTRGRVFKDSKPNEPIKFEISKEDVIEGLKTSAEIGAAAVEVAGAGVTGGASELIIIGKWLLVDLPELYSKVKAVINFVNTVRSIKLDSVKKLFTAPGIGDLLVKALFGEVQGLPVIGNEEREEQGESEQGADQNERGLIKVFHVVMKVINTLKQTYSKVAGFINEVLSTINITTKPWFKPFSMAYASIVHAIAAISNPGAAFGVAVSKIREVAGNLFSGLKTRVGDTVGEIKKQIENFTNPTQLLHRLADKAIEMVLNFIITHPPSPAIKLLFKVIESVSKESIIESVRKNVPLADKIINKIAESDTVKSITEPLKKPVEGIFGAVDNVAQKATETITNVEGKVEGLLGDGVQMVKDLTGIDPEQPGAEANTEAETAPKEEKQLNPKSSAKGGSLSNFLDIIKQGIHSHVLAMGEQFLIESGKSLTKAAVSKGVQALKGAASRVKALILVKQDFKVNGKQHELWVEERDTEIVALVASEPLKIQEKIEAYRAALSDLKEPAQQDKAKKLIDELQVQNTSLQASSRKGRDALRPLVQKMADIVAELEGLTPLAQRFKERPRSPKAKEDVRLNPGTGEVIITSDIGTPVPRPLSPGYEKMLPSGVSVGLRGWERAHLVGPGTGKEFAAGIMYAPEQYNISYQAIVENLIRDEYDRNQKQKKQGAVVGDRELWQRCHAIPFDKNTRRLKQGSYKIFYDDGEIVAEIELKVEVPTAAKPIPGVIPRVNKVLSK